MTDHMAFLHITYGSAVFISFALALGVIVFKLVNDNDPPANV